MLELKPSSNGTGFTDVAAGSWYEDAIGAAADAGLVNGMTEDKFAPNEKITREQMAVMLVRAYEWKLGTQTSGSAVQFTDNAQISGWAQEAVQKAVAMGLMVGRGNQQFAPAHTATRAESAEVMYRMMNDVE